MSIDLFGELEELDGEELSPYGTRGIMGSSTISPFCLSGRCLSGVASLLWRTTSAAGGSLLGVGDSGIVLIIVSSKT